MFWGHALCAVGDISSPFVTILCVGSHISKYVPRHVALDVSSGSLHFSRQIRTALTRNWPSIYLMFMLQEVIVVIANIQVVKGPFLTINTIQKLTEHFLLGPYVKGVQGLLG